MTLLKTVLALHLIARFNSHLPLQCLTKVLIDITNIEDLIVVTLIAGFKWLETLLFFLRQTGHKCWQFALKKFSPGTSKCIILHKQNQYMLCDCIAHPPDVLDASCMHGSLIFQFPVYFVDSKQPCRPSGLFTIHRST